MTSKSSHEMEFAMEGHAAVLEAVEEIVRLNKEQNALLPFYFYDSAAGLTGCSYTTTAAVSPLGRDVR